VTIDPIYPNKATDKKFKMKEKFSKPSLFSDYFTSRKAQQANESLVTAVMLLDRLPQIW
jgi:hypothetical protein